MHTGVKIKGTDYPISKFNKARVMDSNFIIPDEALLSAEISDSFCHLALIWKSKDELEEWRLSFISEPSPAIVFCGRLPTLEEMVKVCSVAGMPATMVQVFMICAHTASEKQN